MAQEPTNPPPADPAEPLAPTRKLSKRFKLLRRLWYDQHSHVFEVFDRSRERHLALRLLSWSEDPRITGWFKQEFRLLSELRHPGVVKGRAWGHSWHLFRDHPEAAFAPDQFHASGAGHAIFAASMIPVVEALLDAPTPVSAWRGNAAPVR